ncbi:MAG TPA: BolA family transcriptional regulator, partial [Marinobacter sp.]|nr:BolA family transcriptional regulator [Marinobacter sp.]
MKVQSAIETKLADAFEARLLQVENESHMHSVPPNSETHFKVTLVSPDFAGQMKVRRHQAIYKVLADELAGSVHALSLHLFTPEEWQASGQATPDSP